MRVFTVFRYTSWQNIEIYCIYLKKILSNVKTEELNVKWIIDSSEFDIYWVKTWLQSVSECCLEINWYK